MRLRRHIVAASAVAAWVACTAIAAAAAPLASSASYPVAGPWSLAPGEYYTELSGSSFTTSTWYNDDGKRVGLGGQAQQRAATWSAELGWTPSWSVQFSLPVVTNSVSAAGAGASATGMSDLGLGLRMKLSSGRTASALQLRWEGPAGYNAKLTPPLGDGLQKLSASLQFGGALDKWAFWQLGGGYRYDFLSISGRKAYQGLVPASPPPPAADHNWSDHVTVNAASGLWLDRLQVAGLYAGDFPISTGRALKSTLQAVGTRFTYRVDERIDAFAGSWHTPTASWGSSGSSGHMALNKNTAHIDEFYVGIAWKSTKLNRLQGFLGNDTRP